MAPPSVGRIRRRATFVALRRPSGRAAVGPIRVSWVPPLPTDPYPLVGYAVGRRVGGAVERNRLRRRLREAVKQVPAGPGAYLIAADREAAELDFGALASTVGSAMASAVARGTAR